MTQNTIFSKEYHLNEKDTIYAEVGEFLRHVSDEVKEKRARVEIAVNDGKRVKVEIIVFDEDAN